MEKYYPIVPIILMGFVYLILKYEKKKIKIANFEINNYNNK